MRLADARTEDDVAAFFRENGERIRQTMAEKAQRGEPSGPVPLGYMYAREGLKKRVVLDPEKAPLVREMFVMAAAGYPIRRIIREVTAMGLTSVHWKPLGPSSVLKILRNPLYAGLVRHGHTLTEGGHEPLVERRLFALVQKKLSRNCRNPRTVDGARRRNSAL